MTRSMRFVVWAILIAVVLFFLISLALFVFNVNLTPSSTMESGSFVAAISWS